MRKNEREGRGKWKGGEGKGPQAGRESLGVEGREEKGVGKKRGEGKFRRGARPPKYFFLEPRLSSSSKLSGYAKALCPSTYCTNVSLAPRRNLNVIYALLLRRSRSFAYLKLFAHSNSTNISAV